MVQSHHPLESEVAEPRRRTTRVSGRLDQLMNEPVSHRTSRLGTDSGWALKLKDCIDTATHNLHVHVFIGKPTHVCAAAEADDMLFELETDRGKLQVVRSHSGEYRYTWLE